MRLCAVVAVLLLWAGGFADAQTATNAPVAAIPVVQHWTKFTDPQEAAFSLDLPEGWTNSGGTARLNALQYRNWVLTLSPDGTTAVVINDPNDPSYINPSPLLAMAGMGIGSLYSAGAGTLYVVEPYQSGQAYATQWGQSKLAKFCTSVKVTASRARPDITDRLNSYSQMLGIVHDIGEAQFSCNKSGVEMTAYVLVGVTSLGAGGIWFADTVESFAAPTKVAGVAAGVLAHMVGSVQVSLEWLARNSDTAVAVSRAATQSNAAISDMIMRGWEDRGAVMDHIMEADSRVRLGIDIYTNPDTGTRYVVANDHKYYWANPSGTIVGTDTDTAPNGFNRLQRVPP